MQGLQVNGSHPAGWLFYVFAQQTVKTCHLGVAGFHLLRQLLYRVIIQLHQSFSQGFQHHAHAALYL
ncbi:hypothetical protein SAMN05444008_12430 [Cnuella takakiae]|uniref:Uncharacterized protein n=1 Tax=Cnuella takakiae TaxID=1302690 RepID=A0A1M5IL79_9BACT|nr:hypothetical protein SAMN05444008_12430 [Cnuella takakiae]